MWITECKLKAMKFQPTHVTLWVSNSNCSCLHEICQSYLKKITWFCACQEEWLTSKYSELINPNAGKCFLQWRLTWTGNTSKNKVSALKYWSIALRSALHSTRTKRASLTDSSVENKERRIPPPPRHSTHAIISCNALKPSSSTFSDLLNWEQCNQVEWKRTAQENDRLDLNEIHVTN